MPSSSLHTAIVNTSAKKELLLSMLETNDNINEKLHGKTAEELALHNAMIEMQTIPVLVTPVVRGFEGMMPTKPSKQETKEEKQKKAQEYYQMAHMLAFASLAQKLIRSDRVTANDVRELDYLQSPTPPFDKMELDRDDLLRTWNAVIKQSKDTKNSERVAYLFNAYLGTQLNDGTRDLKHEKLSFNPTDDKRLNYLDQFFTVACNLQVTHSTHSEPTPHRRRDSSDARYKKLGEIREQHYFLFKTFLEKQNGFQKIESILKVLESNVVWRRRNGETKGVSTTSTKLCAYLVESLQALESKMIEQKEWLPLLNKVLQHNIVQSDTKGNVAQNSAWKAIEILRERALPLGGNKRQLIADIQHNRPFISAYAAEKKAQECEYKSRQLNGPDRIMVRKYSYRAQEYREMARIAGFADMAKQVIEAKVLTSEHVYLMGRMREQMPPAGDLKQIWQAVNFYHAKNSEALQKTAFLFNCYLGTKLEAQLNKEETDNKHNNPALSIPNIQYLDELFTAACVRPKNNERYNELERIRKNFVVKHCENQLSKTPEPEKKLRLLLEYISHPAVFKRRDGEDGISQTVRDKRKEIITLLTEMEAKLDEAKTTLFVEKNRRCHLLKTLLQEVQANKIFRSPVHGGERLSKKSEIIDQMQKRLSMRMVDDSTKAITTQGINVTVFTSQPQGREQEYESLDGLILTRRNS